MMRRWSAAVSGPRNWPVDGAHRRCKTVGSMLWVLALCVVLATVDGASYDDQLLTSFTDDQNVGGSFQHLVGDLRTGRLYVSATNRLYQLDAKLSVEAVVTTGPQADNPFCPPPPTADCHDARRVPTDAVSKALALDQRDERLIACTNLFQVKHVFFVNY